MIRRTGLALLALVSLATAAHANETTPTSEEIDRFALETRPELRTLMTSNHCLGLVGVGQVNGEPAWSMELLGWRYWDRRFYGEADLGGLLFSPKLFGVGRDPATPTDRGNLLLPLGEGMLGVNLIGVRGDSMGYEPLFDLNGRAFLSTGLGAAAGYTVDKSGRYGMGVSAGPFVGLRYKIADWHNINWFGRYFYGFNRGADTYETAFHASVGTSVIELGYRGGSVGTYLQTVSGVTTSLGDAPEPEGWGAWFLRFSQGY